MLIKLIFTNLLAHKSYIAQANHYPLMRGLNKATLIGNLGKDPELKVLERGVEVAKFSVATTEMYTTQQGQTKTDTTWHTVVAWRKLAALAAKYLHKGSLVYLEGKLSYRHYDDKEGTRHYITEIVAEELIMLDKKIPDQSPTTD
jgi:single-strand DNA-binding protein